MAGDSTSPTRIPRRAPSTPRGRPIPPPGRWRSRSRTRSWTGAPTSRSRRTTVPAISRWAPSGATGSTPRSSIAKTEELSLRNSRADMPVSPMASKRQQRCSRDTRSTPSAYQKAAATSCCGWWTTADWHQASSFAEASAITSGLWMKRWNTASQREGPASYTSRTGCRCSSTERMNSLTVK